MNIRKAAHDISEYVVGLRRHFHMYPESSLNEFETSKKIRQELDKLGIKYEVVADTGVVARIHGKAEGKTVLLRADMDALEIEEKIHMNMFQKIRERCMHVDMTDILQCL